MSEGHWRNLTARRMPWRPRAGQEYLASDGRTATDGPDPLGDPPRPPRWNVPGPLGAVGRLGGQEWQALYRRGQSIVCVSGSGEISRFSVDVYEHAIGIRRPPRRVLYAEIDGKQIPLTGCDWVLYEPCGCARTIHVAATPEMVCAADEEAAWGCLFNRARERQRARRTGWRVELMTRDRAMAEFTRAALGGCPHKTLAEAANA